MGTAISNPFAYHQGLVLFLGVLLGCCVVHACRKPGRHPTEVPIWAQRFDQAWPWVFMSVTLIGMGSYLAYPSFADIVESSVVVLGHRLLQGEDIYPQVFDHTLSGLLYSPLLFEINAVALTLPLAPEFSTKLPPLLAYLGVAWVCVHIWKDRRVWLYGLFIGPFKLVFMNSGQPHLLLFTALALLVMARMPVSALRAGLVGLLAGACMSIKLHGVLYVAAIYLVMVPRWWTRPMHLGMVFLGAASAFLLAFAPDGVSLTGFLGFIRMASQHGLVPRIFAANMFFISMLWLPLLVLWFWQESPRQWPIAWHSAWALLLVEVIAAAIGSKNGAGSWHLLPFVLAHGQLLAMMLPSLSARSMPAILPAFIAIFLATVVNTMLTAHASWQNWSGPRTARAELLQLASRYPGLVLDAGQDRGYEHTYHRIHLERMGVKQIDIPGYVDLHSAGVSDRPLADALRTCLIPAIAVPRGHQAFVIASNYTRAPLFSDAVRDAFHRAYRLDTSGSIFDVHVCRAP